jgi:hypothetical protein
MASKKLHKSDDTTISAFRKESNNDTKPSPVQKDAPVDSTQKCPKRDVEETYHSIHTIVLQTVFFLPLDIVCPQNFCETPVENH